MAVEAVEELGFEETLKTEVVEKGLCACCGACVAFCPYGAIELGPRGPELVDMCLKCGNCYSICPRYRFDLEAVEEFFFGRTRRPDEDFGVHRAVVVARSKDPEVLKVCQDGGVVSTLVKYLVGSGRAVGAVLSGVSKEAAWTPEARIALAEPEVLECAGSRYTYTRNMLLNVGVMGFLSLMEGARGVFVGLPCQVRAVRKFQMLPAPEIGWHEAIGPVIGLFCTETFDQRGLIEGVVKGKLGLDPADVVKMNIKKGRLYFYLRDGSSKHVRVRDLKDIVREGCRACTDFSAELADISVGSVGLEGWNLVILRSKLGEEIFEEVVGEGYLEVKEPDEKPLKVLRDLTALKHKRASS